MVQACLIGLIASLGVFGDQLGSLYINRPIILAPLVGLVLGNLHQGLIIGASLELFFMGLSVLGLMFHRIRLSAVFWPLHLQFHGEGYRNGGYAGDADRPGVTGNR